MYRFIGFHERELEKPSAIWLFSALGGIYVSPNCVKIMETYSTEQLRIISIPALLELICNLSGQQFQINQTLSMQ